MHTWLNDSSAAVAWFSCKVVLHAAVALFAADAQTPGGKGVHNENELSQEGLQEPQLWPHMLQAVLDTDDGRHCVQPADGSLCRTAKAFWSRGEMSVRFGIEAGAGGAPLPKSRRLIIILYSVPAGR